MTIENPIQLTSVSEIARRVGVSHDCATRRLHFKGIMPDAIVTDGSRGQRALFLASRAQSIVRLLTETKLNKPQTH